jgi:hypothetical protein
MMASLEVLSTRVESGVAVVTLGSPSRIFFDPEMSDALLEAMTGLAADEAVRHDGDTEAKRRSNILDSSLLTSSFLLLLLCASARLIPQVG